MTAQGLSSAGLGAPTAGTWRSFVTAVKSQGGCGSCWAFAATVPLEFIYRVATGNRKQLAEQLYLDCTYEKEAGRDGCDGGDSGSVWDWVKQHDNYAWAASSIQYTGSDRYCSYTSYGNVFQGEVEIVEVKWFYEEGVSVQDSSMVAALQDGPIVNYFEVENDFYSYSSGHYDGCWTGQNNGWHAVSTVGYDQYSWEVKNSWGTDWGDNGEEYRENCPSWISLCHSGDYVQFMKEHCRRTCGQCDKEDDDPDCVNKMPGCAVRAAAGRCESEAAIMLVSCKKSCNACGNNDGDGDQGKFLRASRVLMTSQYSDLVDRSRPT
eukprot:sb/3466841/